jgi:thiol:disulfide interchange protein
MTLLAPIRRLCAFALLVGLSLSAGAQGVDLKQLAGGDSSSDDFLKPDQAFVLTAESESADGITLRWQIAKDYYLYRDKVAVTTTSSAAVLGTPILPAGKTKHDEYFGEQVVYYDELVVNVPVSRKSSLAELPLEVTYQAVLRRLRYPPIRGSRPADRCRPEPWGRGAERARQRHADPLEQDLTAERYGPAAPSACHAPSRDRARLRYTLCAADG